VVARRQLVALGLSRTVVGERLRSGYLVRLHRGVYAVGHRRLRREGYWLAAVLAAGPEAALSHRDAAALHGVRPTQRSSVDVTTTADRRSFPGVRVHQTRVLDAQDVTSLEGIPVTSVARTLVDLATVVSADSLAKALSEAERLALLDVRALHAARARTRTRRGPGHARLAKALAELKAQGTTLTRSSLENAFLNLTTTAGLPTPQVNVHLGAQEVDACWPAQRLVVELDGWEFHRSRRAFQRDRAKTNELTAAGYRVVRFTHHDVAHRPGHVVEVLRRLGLG
jgi:hypothetical protein